MTVPSIFIVGLSITGVKAALSVVMSSVQDCVYAFRLVACGYIAGIIDAIPSIGRNKDSTM